VHDFVEDNQVLLVLRRIIGSGEQAIKQPGHETERHDHHDSQDRNDKLERQQFRLDLMAMWTLLRDLTD